jgi:cellulose synthase/poly-beta-1,6-N-acetylglucosamine synthase-like glycosyltransferase
VIGACAKLQWPRDRLEIQVVDDSDDDTRGIVDAAVRRLREQGVDVQVVRRAHRSGYKAGALAAATARARGEFIAIFDADFVPPPDFLQSTIPAFDDAGIALVQGRWEHINIDDNWLTRAQGVLLDAHFAVEQAIRDKRGYFWNFNGTAGVWRKEAIEDAGGWQADTLTEDMDLSYRAQLRGWRMAYLQGVAAPAELPGDIGSYLGQQRRWAKGGAQTARKLASRVISAPLGLRRKFEALMHLYTNHGYLLKFVVVPMLPVYVVVRHDMGLDWLDWFDAVLVAINFLSLAAFYGLPVRRLGRGWQHAVVSIPVAILLETGIAVQKALAVFQGLSEFHSHFERTAKSAGQDIALASRYTSRLRWPGGLELLAAGWLAAASVLLAWLHMDNIGAMVFITFGATAFGLAGWAMLRRERRLRRLLLSASAS